MPKQFPPEFRQRALRMLDEAVPGYDTEFAAIKHVAQRLGVSPERIPIAHTPILSFSIKRVNFVLNCCAEFESRSRGASGFLPATYTEKVHALTNNMDARPADFALRRDWRSQDGATKVLLEDLSPRAHRGGEIPWARWRGRLLRIGVPLAIVALWQIASSAEWISETTLPSPQIIGKAYQELWQTGQLQRAIPVSLARAGVGLAFGGGLGLLLGTVAGLWKIGEEAFDVTMQMLRTIPFIALVPLFVTWFGIGEFAKVLLIAFAALAPMYLNTYHAVRGTDPKLIEAGHMFGLPNRRIALRIVLPTALPGILTGLRYSCAMSVLALVLAEQVNATNGIGYLIENAENNQRADIVIAGILVYAALGVVIDLLMRLLERAALPWRGNVALG